MTDILKIKIPLLVDFDTAKKRLDAFISSYEKKGIKLTSNLADINKELKTHATILGKNGEILSVVEKTNSAFATQGKVIEETGKKIKNTKTKLDEIAGSSEKSAQSLGNMAQKFATWLIILPPTAVMLFE